MKRKENNTGHEATRSKESGPAGQSIAIWDYCTKI